MGVDGGYLTGDAGAWTLGTAKGANGQPVETLARPTGELIHGGTVIAQQGDVGLPRSSSNCVLAVPATGSVTTQGDTVTLHAGTRVKLSDGLYPDGSARSLIAEVPQDYVVQMGGNAPGQYAMVASLDRGMAIVVPRSDFTRGDGRPAADTARTQLWHDSRRNMYSFSPAGSDQWIDEGNRISPELASLSWTGSAVEDFRPTEVFRVPSEQDVRSQAQAAQDRIAELAQDKPSREIFVDRGADRTAFTRAELEAFLGKDDVWYIVNAAAFGVGDFALVRCTVSDEGDKPVILHGKVTGKFSSGDAVKLLGMWLEDIPAEQACGVLVPAAKGATVRGGAPL